MDLRSLIEIGNNVAKTQVSLAEMLGVSSMQITHAKAGRGGLPDYACFKLAALIGIDPAAVIAASALVTEKNPERRAVFAPFVQESANDALMRVAKTVVKRVGRASSLN